ncbi:MAG: amidase, partial [Acidobacteria bacterium]|nr:amidase [Acidobacteriota bacterium]
GDRAGIHCKTVPDAARVLDAIKGFEPADLFTALPKGIIPNEPYTSFLVPDAAVAAKPLKGVRVALAREFMVKHTRNDTAISDMIDKEVKAVLRDKLGADLVESIDPLYPDDPSVPNIKYTFQDAFAEILPHNVPEYFFQTLPNGELEFAVPGWDVRSIEYMVALSLGQAPLSPKINLRRISASLANPRSPYTINKYLRERGDAKVKDWASWVANAKFKTESDWARARNAIADKDPRADPPKVNYLKLHSVLRMVVLKVRRQNTIDVFVNPEQTTAPYLLGGAPEPEVNNRPSLSCCGAFTALMGAPEIEVPAGYTRVAYDPQYELSADRKSYVPVTGQVLTEMKYPMPVSLMVWSGPGFDGDVIKVASAYESATHHRVPPPAFGPVKGVRDSAQRR